MRNFKKCFTLYILKEFLKLCFYGSYNIPIIIYTLYSRVKLTYLYQLEKPGITDLRQNKKGTQIFKFTK